MKYSKRLIKRILDDITEGYTIKETCARNGIARETFFSWKRERADFSDSLTAAEEQKWALLRGSLDPAIKKMVEGYKETYLEKTGTLSKDMGPNGQPKLNVTEVKEVTKIFPPQPAFLQFLMKNLIPEKFSDKAELKVTGSIDVSNTRFSLKTRIDNPANEQPEA